MCTTGHVAILREKLWSTSLSILPSVFEAARFTLWKFTNHHRTSSLVLLYMYRSISHRVSSYQFSGSRWRSLRGVDSLSSSWPHRFECFSISQATSCSSFWSLFLCCSIGEDHPYCFFLQISSRSEWACLRRASTDHSLLHLECRKTNARTSRKSKPIQYSNTIDAKKKKGWILSFGKRLAEDRNEWFSAFSSLLSQRGHFFPYYCLNAARRIKKIGK